MSTRGAALLQPDAAGLARAAEILTQGGLVSFPTETVYGLGPMHAMTGRSPRYSRPKGGHRSIR
jgi:Putative translation factor (SUA5)